MATEEIQQTITSSLQTLTTTIQEESAVPFQISSEEEEDEQSVAVKVTVGHEGQEGEVTLAKG